MNRLKLVVHHRHADERIDLDMLMQEFFPIGQERTQMVLADRRRVDDFPRAVIHQLRARNPAHGHGLVLDDAADFFRRAGGQWALREGAESLEQSFAILQSLFGGRVHALGNLRMLEEFVGRGDDILDLRAGLRLQ